MSGPSDVAPVRGIVLDADLAAKVPEGAAFLGNGTESRWSYRTPQMTPIDGDVLTHIGGRPVDELVAAHDEGKALAGAAKGLAAWVGTVEGHSHRHDLCHVIADFLDAQADRTIDPALVAAWHAQHDTNGGAS